MNNQWAVVTGASSGIGAEFARQLSEKGYSVFLVGRREERLVQVQKALKNSSEILVCDLAEKTDLDMLKKRLQSLRPGIVINNAGFGVCGPFTDYAEEAEGMIRVNIEALHALTMEALCIMEKQGHGSILNVGSAAGLLPCGPYMTDYYATKAYVVSMTSGLGEELRRKGSPVRIFCLCPGPVNTEFNQVAHVHFSLPGITAERCVREALQGMARGRMLIVPGRVVRTGLFLQRFVPRRLVIHLIAGSQKRKME